LHLLPFKIQLHNQQELPAIVIRASRRISTVIKELFSSAVFSAAQSHRYSVNEMLDKVLLMTQDRMQLRNIGVIRSYSIIDCKIWMDNRQMEIALINIMINAIDAMPENAGKLRIATEPVGGVYMITIQDNGIGIAEKGLADINTLLFNRTTEKMGTGLVTSLAILRDNHVRVEVTSEVGRGTRFVLSFQREGTVDKN
jgi:two-component system, sporulation sensor kinase E